MVLNDSNYYSAEADQEYMSVSQFKMFAGSLGKRGCEFNAMKTLSREFEEEPSTAMLIGSFVDTYFESEESHMRFKAKNSQIFTQNGGLKAEFLRAYDIINKIKGDEVFMGYMSGDKQTIMEGELFGSKWKIKMDSYIKDVAIVDLKVVKSIQKKEWVKDAGYMEFVRYWGYDIQGAVYQEIVRQNTGKKLPFYIAAASKEKYPDIEIIFLPQRVLDDAMSVVQANMPRILQVKNKEVEPDRCMVCDCCKKFKKLSKPISLFSIPEAL